MRLDENQMFCSLHLKNASLCFLFLASQLVPLFHFIIRVFLTCASQVRPFLTCTLAMLSLQSSALLVPQKSLLLLQTWRAYNTALWHQHFIPIHSLQHEPFLYADNSNTLERWLLFWELFTPGSYCQCTSPTLYFSLQFSWLLHSLKVSHFEHLDSWNYDSNR